jgi:hypothetical protein
MDRAIPMVKVKRLSLPAGADCRPQQIKHARGLDLVSSGLNPATCNQSNAKTLAVTYLIHSASLKSLSFTEISLDELKEPLQIMCPRHLRTDFGCCRIEYHQNEINGTEHQL